MFLLKTYGVSYKYLLISSDLSILKYNMDYRKAEIIVMKYTDSVFLFFFFAAFPLCEWRICASLRCC